MNQEALKSCEAVNEEEARKIQFLIGGMCIKIEQMRAEIKMWQNTETQASWIDFWIQSKRTQLTELYKQKIIFTKSLAHYLQYGKILEPYEIMRKHAYLTTRELKIRLEVHVQQLIEDPNAI